MKLENWALVTNYSKVQTVDLVLPEDYGKLSCRILGNVYGSEKYEDGTSVITSTIEVFGIESVVTCSGSVYELGKLNKDYAAFIKAFKEGMPVIKNWWIEDGKMCGNIFEMGVYEKTNTNCICGTLVSQDVENNICKLDTANGIVDFFVDWSSINKQYVVKLLVQEPISLTDDFHIFALKRVKPELQGKHKRLLK